MRRWIPLALALPIIAAAGIPLGDTVDPALTVDITPEGFTSLGSAFPALLPGSIPLANIGTADRLTEQACVFGFCVTIEIAKWDLTVSGLEVVPLVDAMAITPTDGALLIDGDLRIGVNSDGNPNTSDAPANIVANASLLYGAIKINQTCTAKIEPFPVNINARMEMEVIDDGSGNRSLDVTIPNDQFGWSWDPSGSDIDLGGSNCLVADIRDLLNRIGWDPLDLIIPLAESQVDGAVRGFVGDLETTVEDAFGQASIEEQIALGDTVATLSLQPSAVEIVPDGMRLSLESGIDVVPHPCVVGYGLTESTSTPNPLPAIGTAPPALAGHHVGAFASDDFVNAALFSLWSGGLLCYTVTEADGLPVNTSLLGLLSADAFDELFPETDTLIIETRPARPPEATFGGTHAINLEIRELGLDMYAPLDHRFVRVLGSELATDVGVNLNFDDQNGQLAIDVDLDPSQIQVSVVHNEFAPDYSTDIEESFGGLFDAIVGPLVGSLLSDLAFPLPAFEGLGLQSLDAEPAGAAGDFLGLYANVGLVDYEASGCDSSGGGCGGGCASGTPARPILFLFPLLFAWRRRRS